MKSKCLFVGLCAVALGLSINGAVAHEAHKKEAEKTATAAAGAGMLHKLNEKDKVWAAKERAAYPLTVCLTSDEKLGSMGDNAEFIYREKGKADRLLVFCCAGCEDDFKKEPAKFLAKLDAAAKQKKAKS
jgi:hypothetical protein